MPCIGGRKSKLLGFLAESQTSLALGGDGMAPPSSS